MSGLAADLETRDMGDNWFHATSAALTTDVEIPPGHFTEAQLAHLRRWAAHGARSRMQFERAADYVIGMFYVPVLDRDGDEVWMRRVLVLATHKAVLTVDDTPEGRPPIDPDRVAARLQTSIDRQPGTLLYLVIDDIAWAFTRLAEGFEAEVNEIEDSLDDSHPHDSSQGDPTRKRLRAFRSDLHRVRAALTPTEEAVHYIIAGTDLEGTELFPAAIEERLKDTYDRLRYVSESLDVVRDELGSLRDYLQSCIANEQNEISIAQNELANEQNEIMKALTIVAALVLIPTFVVGFYGQNFDRLPGRQGAIGFWSVSVLMLVIVSVELWYLWRRGWIGPKDRGDGSEKASL